MQYSMNKFAIYTALIGGYDSIRQPLVIDDRFDYILFTDEVKEKKIGVWRVRKVNYVNTDKTRVARFVKTHPMELLPEYAGTLWIDGSLQITSNYIYSQCLFMYNQGVQLASVKHPLRDCIFDEAYVVYGLDSEKVIFDWCHLLRMEKYPRHNGLLESGLLYRSNDNLMEKMNEMWWNLLNQHSRRDQLSLNYVLWKIPQVKIAMLLPEGESVWNSGSISIYQHEKTATKRGRRGIKETFWEHARNRCRGGMEEKTEQFREFHYWVYGLNPIVAKILLHLWGVYTTIVYGTIIKFRAYKRHKNEN